MQQLNLRDIGALLGPGTGTVLLFSIFLYLLFIFAVIALLNVPEKNMLSTVLMATVLLFIIVAKLSISAPNIGGKPIIRSKDFGMFVLNVGIFVLPLIAVGMTRSRKSKLAAPAIVTSLIGCVYFFMFWIVAQH